MAETKSKSKRIKKTTAPTPEPVAPPEPPPVERVILRRDRSMIRTIIAERAPGWIVVPPILSVDAVYSVTDGDDTRDYRAIDAHTLEVV
jgi:hypothetical protein